MNQNLKPARTRAAEFAYNTFDFIDARREGQFAWVIDEAANEMRRTVFLAPVEAEEGVEMVQFHVRFKDAQSTEVAEAFCVTSAGTRYGHPGDEEFVLSVQHHDLALLVADAQRQGLYD